MANVIKFESNDMQERWKSHSMSTKRRVQNRPKVQTEWKPHHIELLIYTVERHSSLWDKNHKEYKRPTANTWQKVSDSLGYYSAEECKAKWNNLRVTFNTNYAKYACRNGQDTEESLPKWRYFNSLLFLKTNRADQTTNSISSRSEMNQDVTPAAASQNPQTADQSRKRRATRLSPSPQRSPSLSPSPSLSIPSPSASPFPALSVKSFKELPIRAVEYINADRDDLNVFGDFIVTELRGIPRDRAAYVKRKMMRHFVDLMDEVAECTAESFIRGKKS